MRWVLDPALSPAGDVAYVLKFPHPNNHEERYRFELVLLEGGEPAEDGVGRRLLPGFDAVVRKPRWSPSGETLAFLSNAAGANQVWLLDVASGALRQLSATGRSVVDLAWSPNGSRIAVIANVPDESGASGEYKPGRYRVIRRLGYKTDGSGYWDNAWPQLFLL